MRDALREELTAPERLTIVETSSMVLLTSGDGHTTRLSTDGKGVKDESTKTERKTKWDGEKLVSELSGLPRGKLTETYSVDPEHRQLHVTIKIEGQGRQAAFNHVYDRQPE